MAKRKETEFDKLARLIKGEGDDIRKHMVTKSEFKTEIARLERKMDERFAAVIRRLDEIIQMQLDEHAGRLRKLETAVFPVRK